MFKPKETTRKKITNTLNINSYARPPSPFLSPFARAGDRQSLILERWEVGGGMYFLILKKKLDFFLNFILQGYYTIRCQKRLRNH